MKKTALLLSLLSTSALAGPVDNFTAQVNSTISANGQGSITGGKLNSALLGVVPIFQSMGTWNSNGAFSVGGSGANLTGLVAAQIGGLAPSATTDTTNAGNIATGTLGVGRLPVIPPANGGCGVASLSGLLKGNGASPCTAAGSADIAAAQGYQSLSKAGDSATAAFALGTTATGIDAQAFGADPSGAFDLCTFWPSIIAARPSYGGEIRLRPGYYTASCKLTATAPFKLSTNGAQSTVINFTGSGANAGIAITSNDPNAQIDVADITLVATKATSVPCISATYNAFSSSQHGPRIRNTNCMAASGGYWAAGPTFQNGGYGTMRDNTVSGIFTNSLAGINPSANTNQCYALLGQSPGVEWDHNLCYMANIGLYASGDSEGAKAHDGEAVAVNYGYYLDGSQNPNLPGLWLHHNHANAYNAGVVLVAWNQSLIDHMLLYKTGSQNWTGVALNNYVSGSTTYGSNGNVLDAIYSYGFHSSGKGGTAIPFSIDTAATNNVINSTVSDDIDYVFNQNAGSGPNYVNNPVAFDLANGWVLNPNTSIRIINAQPLNVGTDAGYFPLNAGTTSFSVGGIVQRAFTTNNSAATTISAITGGYVGEKILIRANDNNTTIQNNSTLQLCGSTNKTLVAGNAISLEQYQANIWQQTCLQ